MAKTQVSQPATTRELMERNEAKRAMETLNKLQSLSAIAAYVNSEVSTGMSTRLSEVNRTFGTFEPIKKSDK